MADGPPNADVTDLVRRLYALGPVGDLSDAQLLDRFINGRGEPARAAFAALVDRHGPMVHRVCGQVLTDPHDAQDAFQATFLVLARKAGSVRKAGSIGSWLHGVARRVAVRSRADAARRRARERHGPELLAQTPAAPTAGSDPESWPELHDAIAGLPAHYREPVVLCYLEGLSTETAAARIGCARGTVLSRLSRARDRLRTRLTRQGVAVGAVPLATVPLPTLPPALVEATARVSLTFAEQNATAAATASASAVALARGVLHAMTLSKLKTIGAALALCLFAAGGVRTLAYQYGNLGFGPAARPEPTTDPTAETFQSLDRLREVLSLSYKHVDQMSQELGAMDEELMKSLRLGKRARTNLLGDIDRLRGALNESNQRTASIHQELKAIRAELSALSGGTTKTGAPTPVPPRTGVMTKTQNPPFPPPRGMTPNIGSPPIGSAGLAPATAKEFPYTRMGDVLFISSPYGKRVKVYDTKTTRAETLEMGGTEAAPVEITPVERSGFAALHIVGPKISRIAAAGGIKGPWVTIDLREPVEGMASPIVGPNVAAYKLGQYVYAFSGPLERWGVVELPTSVQTTPVVGPSSVTIEGGGHIYHFNAATAEWTDTDLRAILNMKDDPAPKPGPDTPER